MDLLNGALDLSRIEMSAKGLKALIHGRFAPLRPKFRDESGFPDFMISTYSIVDDFGYVINVWMVPDTVEKYRVIGGVQSSNVDRSKDYRVEYQRLLDEVLNDDEQSVRVIEVLDHVITKHLIDIRRG